MGENVIALTYIPSDKPIVYILRKDKKELARLYANDDIKFIYIGNFLFKCLSLQTSYSFISNCPSISKTRISKIGNSRIVGLDIYSGNHWIGKLGLNIYQLYRLIYSNEEKDGHYGYCPRFEANVPRELDSMNSKKVIVINPYATTIKFDSESLFSDFVIKAQNKGYEVVCLIHGSQEGVNGCINLDCTLEEIGTFLSKNGILVALRSGFVDVMIHTGVPTICLQYEGYHDYKSFLFNSEEIKRINPNVVDILFNSSMGNDDIIDKIFEQINEWGN